MGITFVSFGLPESDRVEKDLTTGTTLEAESGSILILWIDDRNLLMLVGFFGLLNNAFNCSFFMTFSTVPGSKQLSFRTLFEFRIKWRTRSTAIWCNGSILCRHPFAKLLDHATVFRIIRQVMTFMSVLTMVVQLL